MPGATETATVPVGCRRQLPRKGIINRYNLLPFSLFVGYSFAMMFRRSALLAAQVLHLGASEPSDDKVARSTEISHLGRAAAAVFRTTSTASYMVPPRTTPRSDLEGSSTSPGEA